MYLHLWESKDNGVITSHLCSASPFFLRIQPSTSLSSKGEGALAIQKVLKCQTKNHQFWKTKSSFSYPHEAKVHKKKRKTVLHLSPKLNLRNSVLQQKDLLFGTHPFTQPCFSLLFFFNSTLYNHQVRNTTAIFIINLSVSDLLFGCFNMPLAASIFITRRFPSSL